MHIHLDPAPYRSADVLVQRAGKSTGFDLGFDGLGIPAGHVGDIGFTIHGPVIEILFDIKVFWQFNIRDLFQAQPPTGLK
ncbi:MAG: hypothetical protein WBX25_10715 [Rhodomicrobium sp.]